MECSSTSMWNLMHAQQTHDVLKHNLVHVAS